MKPIMDPSFPETDWRTWDEDERYQFGNHHEPWEHPGISDLGRITKVHYGTLDVDSDSRMRTLCLDLWCPDVIARADDLHPDLVDRARLCMTLEADCEDIKDRTLAQQRKETGEITEHNFGEIIKRGLSDEWRALHALYGETKSRLYGVIREFCALIVQHDYSPLPESVWELVHTCMVEINQENMDKGKEDMSFDIPESMDDLLAGPSYRIKDAGWNLYLLSLASYPADNLTSYFHDEILFMNHIQNIVQHSYKDEQILHSGDLFSEDPDVRLSAVREALTFMGAWWT